MTEGTPRQEPLIVETPFGATMAVSDWRDASFKLSGQYQTAASLRIGEGLVINNKRYGEMTYYYEHGHGDEWRITSSSYGERMTDSARTKLWTWLDEFAKEHLEAYRHELTADDARARLKSNLSYEVYSALHASATSDRAGGDEVLRAEVIDELLRDALAAREAGESYSKIYFGRAK